MTRSSNRRTMRTIAVALVAVCLAAAPTAAAGSDDTVPSSTTPASGGSTTPAAGAGTPTAAEAVEAALAAVAASQRVVQEAAGRLAAAQTSLVDARELAARNGPVVQSTAALLAEARAASSAALVSSYVEGGSAGYQVVAQLGQDANAAPAARTGLQAVLDERRTRVLAAEAAWAQATDLVRVAAQRVALAELAVRVAEREVATAREAAVQAVDALSAAIEDQLATMRMFGGLTVGEIPVVAFNAYRSASEWASVELGCDAPWWAMAAIGRHESHHGHYRAALLDDGRAVPGIIGIPLDGTRSLVVRDTDAGTLDGDSVWDRAVGPMQVIPATWRWYAATFDLDGNRDGLEDPHNINDAARLAASMLCRNSSALRTEVGLRRGLWSYNPSQSYNDRVYTTALRYSTLAAS